MAKFIILSGNPINRRNFFLSRDLIDLGTDPASHIIYPGGNAFYISEMIEDRLLEQGAGDSLDELEDIFMNRLPIAIRKC